MSKQRNMPASVRKAVTAALKKNELGAKNAVEQAAFYQNLKAMGFPLPVKEHQFHPLRKWRFDYCWPDLMLAIEVEGGVSKFYKSRHTTPEGYKEDCAKYNAATILGWRVLRYDWLGLTHPSTIIDMQILLRNTGGSLAGS